MASKNTGNVPFCGQKHASEGRFDLFMLLFGQFHGFTHQLNGQFQGIPVKKSQPYVRTFRGRAAPLKRTFGGVNAPDKPSFRLIP
jgi:hypothetical protein